MGTNSGFEVFRRIVREEDPAMESTEFGLRFGFQLLVLQKCYTITDTMKLLKAMESIMSEYRDKTGKEMDEVLKTTVLTGPWTWKVADRYAGPGSNSNTRSPRTSWNRDSATTGGSRHAASHEWTDDWTHGPWAPPSMSTNLVVFQRETARPPPPPAPLAQACTPTRTQNKLEPLSVDDTLDEGVENANSLKTRSAGNGEERCIGRNPSQEADPSEHTCDA